VVTVTRSHYFSLGGHDLYPASGEAGFLSLGRKSQDMSFPLLFSLPPAVLL